MVLDVDVTDVELEELVAGLLLKMCLSEGAVEVLVDTPQPAAATTNEQSSPNTFRCSEFNYFFNIGEPVKSPCSVSR